MIKAIFFDLDDTLLWDQKSVKEAFVATCLKASEKFNIDAESFRRVCSGRGKKALFWI